MNELPGFIVLSGPLFPMLVWMVVSIVLVTVLVRPAGSTMRGVAIRLLIFVAILALPFVDEMAGRIYLNYLCSTQAGFRIYKTVELPPEYEDADGNLNIFNEQGYLRHDFWVKNLDESGGATERYSSLFNIDKDKSTVVYKTGHILLGETITFRHWGGWIRKNFSPHNTANSCQFIAAPGFSRKFYGGLFQRTSTFKEGEN